MCVRAQKPVHQDKIQIELYCFKLPAADSCEWKDSLVDGRSIRDLEWKSQDKIRVASYGLRVAGEVFF